MATAALLAAALIPATGCRRHHRSAAGPPDLVFHLLDQGHDPRSPLRYPTEPPPAQKMSLTLHLGMKMKLPGSPVPPVSMPGLRLLIEVESRRAANRDVRYEFTVTDADLTDVESAQPSTLADMRKGVRNLIGATGSVVVDPRGFHRDLTMKAPGASPGQELDKYLDSAKLAIGQMAVPLPDEAVGVGAKWEVIDTLSQDGIDVRETTYYELLARKGPRVRLRAQTVQGADRQHAGLPGLPDGVEAQVQSLRGSGSGETELDLRRLVPGSAHEEVETDISFRVQQGQSERVMSVTADSKLDIQPM